MPDYHWGIFLARPEQDRRIAFGEHLGDPVWQEVPGEYRGLLRRLIVTQGDTEPASVEQQRALGRTSPSLYDLRNLFQINVEEGRHLWAMVYLLHAYFGRDGREEAATLLERHSGDPDRPRILDAFNQATPDWLSYFMFTFFTDRDGKYQLAALAESGFDPLARTCRFMLTEEAHHMFVGETGVMRIVGRTCELMKELGTDDSEAVRAAGAIDLPTLQKFINFHYSVSIDLFGQEISTNGANYFTGGLKGRFHESRLADDHPGGVDLACPHAQARAARAGAPPGTTSRQRAIERRLHPGYPERSVTLEPGHTRSRYRLRANTAPSRFQSQHRCMVGCPGFARGSHHQPGGLGPPTP